jgi:hypothetical protein
VLVNFYFFCLCCILGVFQMCMAISFMLDIKSCSFCIKTTKMKMLLAHVNMWVCRFGSNVISMCKFELVTMGKIHKDQGSKTP